MKQIILVTTVTTMASAFQLSSLRRQNVRRAQNDLHFINKNIDWLKEQNRNCPEDFSEYEQKVLNNNEKFKKKVELFLNSDLKTQILSPPSVKYSDLV